MENKESLAIVESLKEDMALGDVFVQSGMFKDIKTQAEAVVKILAGREIGLKPIQSMNEVFIVEGKTSITTKILTTLLVKTGKYDYRVDKIDDNECIISFFRIVDGKKEEQGKSSFNLKDAAKAGLINKNNWKNYPRNMMFCRAFANGQKWYAPDIYSGSTTEELRDITEEPKPTTVLEFDDNETVIVTEEINNGN